MVYPRSRLVAPLLTAAILTLAGLAPAALAVTKSAEKVFDEPTEGAALVYFIREPRFQGSARTMFLYADETFLGVLDNSSYTFAHLEPGEHLLWLNWAKVTEEVELSAGEVYYYSVWTSFTELGEEVGRRLIEEVKHYTLPEEKEIQTAQGHIAKRYEKAERSAAKPDKDYVGTKAKREEHVARWSKVDLASYSVLLVEDFAMKDPKASKRKKDYLVETAPQRLADMLVQTLDEGVFTEVRREAAPEPAEGLLILRPEITQYKPGSETARLMMAGAGSSHLDFLVHLIDASTDEEITSFSGERTWAWGGAAGASRGIHDLEQNVVYEIALYLKRCRGFEEAEPGSP